MFISEEEFQTRINLVLGASYNVNNSYFVKMLRLTRLPFLKRCGRFINYRQILMLKELLEMQKSLSLLKKQLTYENFATEREQLEKKIFIMKEWIRVIQTIADGIAWRAFNFNHPLLRLMSANQPSGHVDDNQLRYLARILIRGPHLVIVNDLTRVLRISDLTCLFPDGRILLYELKRAGKRVKDMGSILKEMRIHKRWFNSQERRLIAGQLSIMDNKITIPELGDDGLREAVKADIIDLDFDIPTHFRTVKKLLKIANRKDFAQALLEDGYFLVIIAADKISTKNQQFMTEEQREYTPKWMWKEDGSVIMVTNYDSYYQEGGEFPRNLLPYSIFPFRARDCIRLMLGNLLLFVYLDLEILKKKIMDEGWTLEEKKLDTAVLERIKMTKGFEKMRVFDTGPDVALFHITRDDEYGTYNSDILYVNVLEMMASLLKLDFITRSAKYTYLEARNMKRSGRPIAINYVGLKRIFI